VVNEAGTQVELVGRRLSRPAPGLALYRLDGPLRLRAYAKGVDRDGWARSVMEYAAWPAKPSAGTYRLKFALPAGRHARVLEAEAGPVRRRAVLRPGGSVTLELPVSGAPLPPLAIRLDRADLVDGESTRPRLVAARVETLEFMPEKGSRN
jgi:hypothetical protein